MKNYRLTERQIHSYYHHLQQEEKSASTIEKYLRDVQAFAAEHQNKAVCKETVIAYKAKLIEKGYAVRSINSMLSSLNSFFQYLGWADCRVKTLKVQRQIYCTKEKELTKEEYFRLVRMAEKEGDMRMSLLLQTLGGTGIRISELAFVTLETVQNGKMTVLLKGKTRTVFFVRALQQKILRYAAAAGITGGAIFITRTGKLMNRTNIWRAMKRLCAKAGVDPQKVYPHNLRHLFARAFYALEKDIVKLADLLGHSNLATTRLYIIESGDAHRRQLERMHLIL